MAIIFSGYQFTVSGISTSPARGDVYSNNSSEFTLSKVSLTSGAGTLNGYRTSGSNEPSASGNLVRVSGSGDDPIAYSAFNGFTKSITRNPSYPRIWYPIRFNQDSRSTADGGKTAYDNGPSIIIGTIEINNVDSDEVDNASTGLRKFLTDVAIYELNDFSITPPANTNIGKGDNTIINVFFDGGTSLADVFSFQRPGSLYSVKIPYREKVV